MNKNGPERQNLRDNRPPSPAADEDIRDGTDAPADYEPKILALVCTYCTYTAADMAGSRRMVYPTSVRVIKYLCTGRIDVLHILNAFEAGADAVFVSGCEVGDCHYREGNLRAEERVRYAKKLIEEVGLSPDRLEMFHIGASDAPRWAEAVRIMTRRALKAGPSPLRPEKAAVSGADGRQMENRESPVENP